MEVISKGNHVDIAITVDTGIYAAGDDMGGKITILGLVPRDITNMILNTLILVDQAVQKAPIDIIFFESNPSATTFTNNGALTVADADTLKICAVVQILAADYFSFADNCVACVKPNVSLASNENGNMYMALVCRGTPTYVATTDLAVSLHMV
jgi:hypothetical protein